MKEGRIQIDPKDGYTLHVAGTGVVRWLALMVAALLAAACGTSIPEERQLPSPGVPTPMAEATGTPPASAATGTPAPPLTPGPGSGATLPFQTLAAGQAAVYDQPAPLIVVVGEQARLRPVWSQRIASDDPPAVVQQMDFSRQLLVVVCYGRRNTGGYGITVRNIERQGKDVVVTVEARSPVPGTLLPQVITTPWEAVAVERGTLPDWAALRYVVRDGSGRVLAETVPQSAGGG